MMQAELNTALEAARQAAIVCQTVYAQMVERIEKAGREPVTLADYAAQAVIASVIRAAFPEDSFLGEERASDFEAQLSPEQRGQVAAFAKLPLDRLTEHLSPPEGRSGRTWIVDPIDGTKGFLAKRAYAVAIALHDSEGLALGVLACPNLSLDNPGGLADNGLLFYATRGGGAFYEHLEDGQQTPIKVTPILDSNSPLFLATSVETGHSNQGLFEQVVSGLPTKAEAIRLDGQGKYGLVAAGRVGAYFRLVPEPDYREKVWDHAAGAIIVTEAGGIVSDFDGKPLEFGNGSLMQNNRGVVAASAVLYPHLIQAIQRNQP